MAESSRNIPVTRKTQTLSWLRHRAWIIRPIIILTGLAVLVVVTVFFFYRLPGDSYWAALNAALISSIVTIVITLSIAIAAFWERLQKVQEHRVMERFGTKSWQRSAIRMGALEIPDIVITAAATHRVQWSDRAQVEWADLTSPRAKPGEPLQVAMQANLDAARTHADRHKIMLTDGQAVDLRAAYIELVHQANKRVRKFTLTPATSTYFDFLAGGNSMDATVTLDGDETSLRKWIGFTPQSIEEVENLPFSSKIGTGTVVVTRDNMLVLGIRGRTMVAGGQEPDERGRRRVHIAGEGMIPDDLDRRGRLSPRVTAARALFEELAIGPKSSCIGRIEQIFDTGFFFDQLRVQPCFSFLAKVSLDWNELRTDAVIASDFWEVEELIAIPFDIENVNLQTLLLNQHPEIVLASNQAAAAVWFACLYEFGFHHLRDVLSTPSSPQQVGALH